IAMMTPAVTPSRASVSDRPAPIRSVTWPAGTDAVSAPSDTRPAINPTSAVVRWRLERSVGASAPSPRVEKVLAAVAVADTPSPTRRGGVPQLMRPLKLACFARGEMLGETVPAPPQVAAPMLLGRRTVSRAQHLDQLAVVRVGTPPALVVEVHVRLVE